MYSFRTITLNISFSLVVLLAIAGTAVAQTTTPTSTPAEPEPISEVTNTPPTVTPAPPTSLSEEKQRRIINLAANISNRIDAATARLSNIGDRLERRIGKLRDQGINTAPAEAELAKARAALTGVTSSMRAIDRVVFESTTSETPQASWGEVRSLFADAKNNLFVAKAALQASIAALKSATTEAESNPEESVQNPSEDTGETLVN